MVMQLFDYERIIQLREVPNKILDGFNRLLALSDEKSNNSTVKDAIFNLRKIFYQLLITASMSATQ